MDRNERSTGTIDQMWDYGDASWSGTDLTGFGVEATDGSIGSVDEASADVGGSYLVVDTGPWIFGTKVLLPAGLISQVDIEDRKVHVNQTKDQIKNAPEFDPDTYQGDTYRGEVGGYYGEHSGSVGGGTVDAPVNRPAGPDYGKEPIDTGTPRSTRDDTLS